MRAQNGRVPTRTRKPGKMGRYFPVRQSGKCQGILNRLEKSGEDQTKYWKTQGNLR